jgi:hypothetical protein
VTPATLAAVTGSLPGALAALREVMTADGISATSPDRLDAEAERLAREEKQS